jgi:hypothetical protein
MEDQFTQAGLGTIRCKRELTCQQVDALRPVYYHEALLLGGHRKHPVCKHGRRVLES